jgi:hypothetical protein
MGLNQVREVTQSLQREIIHNHPFISKVDFLTGSTRALWMLKTW